MPLSVNTSNTRSFIASPSAAEVDRLAAAHQLLLDKSGRGGDFLGWVDLPVAFDRGELARIKSAAAKIRSDSDALVVIGIGGSYLGARAAIEFVQSPNYNLLTNGGPQIFYAGNSLSTRQTRELLRLLGGKNWSINVISKSGTTTEPAIAFRIFRDALEAKYGKEGARGRIYATTDAARGALRGCADAEGYETFVIPDDVGGRYSVLTPVGLLPICAAGVDIDALLAGAADMRARAIVPGADNPAWQYALARQTLYGKGFGIEVLACYEPGARYICEWWKQLYGESEGKEGKGIFPASVDNTADLHSMGQFIQEGTRNLFETVINIRDTAQPLLMSALPDDADGLNFLAGTSLEHINRQAYAGTTLAHVDGGVPNLRVDIDGCDAFSLGELIYFFEFACGLSGYYMGVNPFDQPGVEAYKKNMFALLGKSGYDELRAELLERLSR